MTRLRTLLSALFSFALLSVAAPAQAATPDSLDAVARDYVRLVLELGARDEGYVDAYYGPAAWRTQAQAHPRTVPQLAVTARVLSRRLEAIRTRRGTLPDRRKLH